MKTLVISTILLVAATFGFSGAAHAQRYPYRSCVNNNSKACQDARNAFAEHHNGLYPEQWFNQNYQGQPGRWQWENADGDDWYQGEQGHWYKEPQGWHFWGDDGDDYWKGKNGWGWARGRAHREGEEHEEHEEHERGRGHHDRD